MADDSNEPATKGDLRALEHSLRSELKDLRTEVTNHGAQLASHGAQLTSLRADVASLDKKIDTRTAELVNHMNEIKDEILRAFGMVEENIRKDMTHIDEHRGLEQRVAALAKAVSSP